ncbi:acyl dehydratase [Halostagnicola larsenii XH-48]|uniref:Acyl dehydratase n=1 Tax=Halostagnicola larsenii XH-48 TaxID=797299 RepID=W0JS78_9EURY|nr:MaoC family dehydratase [Halostagnicola larsenii]AHF99817.1 acyl dehydratase [Halostagnicola larsenii XH-48]
MPTYYEDIEVGDTYSFGDRTISKAEILEFAEQYDPQTYHVDEEAAEDSLFGELIASGWHTASLCMREFVEHVADEAWLGARGIDDLRWIKPVTPDDTLSMTVEIVDKRPLEDDPTIGHVDTRLTAYNQDDEAVITWIGLGIVARRDSDES